MRPIVSRAAYNRDITSIPSAAAGGEDDIGEGSMVVRLILIKIYKDMYD